MEVENAQSVSWPTRTREYFDDVQAEMKRVSWPSWPQVRSTTLVVIITTFLLAGYFFVVDTIFNSLIQKLIDYFTTK
jgi:preprotein translocase subunit SecE